MIERQAISTTRTRKPRDKTKVEGAVADW